MRPSDRQRAGDVVAVADVRDRDAVQGAEPLAQREQVRERLARVVQGSEPVDDRYLRGVGKLGNRLVRARPDHDRVHVARQHPGRVADRLARGPAAARRRAVRAGARRAPRRRPGTRPASWSTAARRPAPPSARRGRPHPAPRPARASARRPARAASRAAAAESSSPVRKWRGGSFKRGILRWMELRALTWNIFHGRDFPPDPSLLTLRSRLLRCSERNDDPPAAQPRPLRRVRRRARRRPMGRRAASGEPAAVVGGARARLRRRRPSRAHIAQLVRPAARARRPHQPRPDRLERGRLEPDPRPRRTDRRAARARAAPGPEAGAAGDGVQPRASSATTASSASPTCMRAPERRCAPRPRRRY